MDRGFKRIERITRIAAPRLHRVWPRLLNRLAETGRRHGKVRAQVRLQMPTTGRRFFRTPKAAARAAQNVCKDRWHRDFDGCRSQRCPLASATAAASRHGSAARILLLVGLSVLGFVQQIQQQVR